MLRAWQGLAVLIAVVMLAPMATALGALLVPTGEIWQHLIEYVLPAVTRNTIALAIAVGLGALLLGTSAAWLTVMYRFPGRRFFAWSLMLPLAIPGYVAAFALTGVFEYSSPLATALRAWGWSLPVLSAGVASAACLILTLYPYVYLLARQAFQSQGVRSIEVAQSLGMTPLGGFRRVALPMARPWLIAGCALVVMETLADFGTVKVFNFDTFTTAIYSAWFGLFSLTAALQMSVMLLALVFVALVLERRARGRRRYVPLANSAQVQCRTLPRAAQIAAAVWCGAIFLVAFAVPVVQLLIWGKDYLMVEVSGRYWGYLRASLLLASIAAVLISLLSVLLGFSARQAPGRVTQISVRLATLGYALPGTVLAVGFFVSLAGVQSLATQVVRALGAGPDTRIILTGTLWVMLLAYAARFLAVAHSPIGSAFERITPRIDDAAKGLGVSGLGLLSRVHLPILRPGLATAALLVFVDVMKELPITLITRPFGWDTLAVRIFQMTAEGEWQRAAVPALTIVVCGLIPVLWLHRRSQQSETVA